MNTTIKKYLSPWRVLWLGTLLMIFIEIGGIFSAATVGGFGAFFILLFVGFILMGASQKFIGGWGAGAVGISTLMAMVIGFGNVARPIWMSMTGQGQNATIVELPNGVIRSELSGSHMTFGYRATRTGGRGHPSATEYRVAPFVDEKWMKGDEINLWVVCKDNWDTDTEFSEIDKCVKEWKNDYSGGYEIDPGDRVDVGKAVVDAKTKYKLISSNSSKYIYSSANPQSEVNSLINLSIVILILTHLIYIIPVLVKWKKIGVTEVEKM